MKKNFDFADVAPAEPKRYAEPTPVHRAARLVWAGPSEMGSHMMRSMLGCQRQFALSHPNWSPRASERTGLVTVLDDLATGVVHGPFTSVDAVGAGGSTVYMIRGTLAHIILAHTLIRETLARGERLVVCGGVVHGAPDDWYTPEEAVELAATLVGTPAHTFALPAARRLLPHLIRWAKNLVTRERVLAVETQLVWHLAAPFAYTARYDLLTESRASGLVSTLDYKSSSDPKGDKTRRYAASAQLMGQDEVGRRWAGQRWSNVRVLLIGDKSDADPTLEVWNWPRHPRTADLERSIATAQAPWTNMVPVQHVARLPGNALFCNACPASVRGVCVTM